MSWHHPDEFFFLCLAGSLAAFLAPSIIDELTTTVDELFGRRRKPPVVKLTRSTVNEKAVDPPLPPKYVDPPSPPKYLKKARPLDGLQRDRSLEQFSRLCESVTPLPPKEQASRVREHFGIVGGACPPLNKVRNRFRRRFTPGEVHRLEQHSHTRL
jgi:hypothetical protein